MRLNNQTRNRKTRLICFLIVSLLLVLPAGCNSTTETSLPSGNTYMSSHASSQAGSESQNEIPDPSVLFDRYTEAWIEEDYETLYSLLSKEAKTYVDEDSFIKRYQNIFSGIEAENLSLVLEEEEDTMLHVQAADTVILHFSLHMDTLAGPVDLVGYRMKLVLETSGAGPYWAVDWKEDLIFPNMDADDQVRARVLQPKRGEILDRNSRGLAVNGELIVIGIAPGRFAAVKNEAIPVMAEKLGISEERIERVYEDAKNPDWFYPVVTLPSDAGDLSAELTSFDGVLYQKKEGRIYPAGEAAGLVIGYIGPITAEELSERKEEDYTAHDQIGKMGLEQVYESRLRGTRGGEITLVEDDSGQLKDIIARTEPVDGETIRLSLDVVTQIKTYQAMKDETGAAAVTNPVTGEILALVSAPSFDPNWLQTYVPDHIQASWNEAEKSPFTNRFKSGYAPGSVFKLVTAAIGLKSGVIDPDEALSISGLKWQPDESWGQYKITRVKDIGRPVTLADALIISDNIYFAQQALEIGADLFESGAGDFAIGEDLPIDYPFYRSQLSNHGLSSEILLADTSYGQGEVLLSPLHIALIYSSLATNGHLMKPILELGSGVTRETWKEEAIRMADVPLLTDILLQVVEDPQGTGYTNTPAQTRMIGKTGTAELKKSFDDTDAQENGWFVAMNIDQPKYTVAMVIEDVKGRGGSHLVVPIVKEVMDDLMSE